MRRELAALILMSTLGCGRSSLVTSPTVSPPSDKLVTVSGPLTLTVTDFATNPGVMWVLPGAQGGAGSVSAQAIRYGSLCAMTVTGRADIAGSRVSLHVGYSPRSGAVCTTEIRAIKYDAVIAGLSPGRYEVHIFHSSGDASDEAEVRVQTVDVT